MVRKKELSIEEILKRVAQIKKNGHFETNYFFNFKGSEKLFTTYEGINTIIFLNPNVSRKEVFYFTSDMDECKKILSNMPENSILNIIVNGQISDEKKFEDTGFCLYDVYQKVGIHLRDVVTETKRMNKHRWNRFYNKKYGTYATEDDLKEIQKIIDESFDSYSDTFYTDEELKEYIKEKNVMVQHEDGEIVSFIIFKIQGKRVFVNLIYNKGWAGVLYSMERTLTLELIKKYGVEYKYGWISLRHKMAWRRNQMQRENVFHYIYKKERTV